MDGQLVGRQITIFYEDGIKVNRKDGYCTSDSEIEICLDKKIIIPRQRIIRIEILAGWMEGGKND